MSASIAPIAILHEHPDWFRPLFAELDRRGLPYVRIDGARHAWDPLERPNFSLLVNRSSPSAYTRGNGASTFTTLDFLHHVERHGIPVVNGSDAYAFEISKARQLTLLSQLGLRYPKARVINDPSRAVEASKGMRFPVVVKANVGGSGAGIVRYDGPSILANAVEGGTVKLGIDGTALVQEYAPLRGGHITRVEVLDGKFLYAINVYPSDSFNLCPADACQTTEGVELERAACAIDTPKPKMRVEQAHPPAEAIEGAIRIAQAAGIDIGGIEYLVDDRDGQIYFYDVNALSNFVADAPRVVGFDPFVTFVDYLERRLAQVTARAA